MAAFFMFRYLLLAWLLPYSVEGHGQQVRPRSTLLLEGQGQCRSLGTPGNAIADMGPVPVHGESMLAENMTHVHERGVQTALVSYF